LKRGGHGLKGTARPGSGCLLGAGAKGQRWYDWAWITIPGTGPGCRYLLIGRSRRTRELASYRCYCPHRVPLATLAMLALAFLSVTAAAEHAQPPPPELTPITRNEIA
jgi:hypothetical protein